METTESQNIYTNVEEMGNRDSQYKEELTEQRIIGDSPFTAVRIEEKWMIVIGKYKIEEMLPSYLACEQYVKDNLWKLIGCFVTAVIEWNNELNQIKTNN